MKTASELAMERLNRAAPAVKLTAEQKKQLAELDAKYAATIAGREISMQGEMAKVAESGDTEKAEVVRQQWMKERQSLLAELEEKKERVRQGGTVK